MTDLTIRSVLTGNGLACVALEGTLDGRTAESLEREVDAAVARGVTKFVFDLEHLTVLTSAGAGVFLGVVVAAQERGGGLALVGPSPQVQHVVDVLGLRDLLPVAENLDSAAARIEQVCAGVPRVVTESA